MKASYHLPCNIAQTLNLIGDKWSLLILHELSIGHQTYNEIQGGLTGIPTNLLSARLKELEEDGRLNSALYQAHPPRYRYTLTESGADLYHVFYSLILWGEKYLQDKCYKRLVHKDCGSSIEVQYVCPHCQQVLERSDIAVEDVHRP